jgi:RNA polymerase sigma-70 factor (ECF subfamily)
VNVDGDSGLVAKAQAGDIGAFEALVAAHRDRVYTLAKRILRNEADAAEVVQEAFLAAYRNLNEFRGDAAFGTWVYRIAANGALMRVRHNKVADQVESTDPSPAFNERGSLVEQVADWRADAEAQTLDSELREAIEKAADALDVRSREVFVLKDLEGLSYEDIAALTGDSVPAIKSRLHRARLSLRAAIDEFYAEREG